MSAAVDDIAIYAILHFCGKTNRPVSAPQIIKIAFDMYGRKIDRKRIYNVVRDLRKSGFEIDHIHSKGFLLRGDLFLPLDQPIVLEKQVAEMRKVISRQEFGGLAMLARVYGNWKDRETVCKLQGVVFDDDNDRHSVDGQGFLDSFRCGGGAAVQSAEPPIASSIAAGETGLSGRDR